ncbi:phospholipase D-like domain-containing protein [Saccharothrix australiensis]|uniref:phospholipase D-like domain-containing protein n=1 Tax=Saccharothrix australiensis TaxID=2072 RepID=UPI000EAE3795
MPAHLQRHAHRLSVDDLIPVRGAGELAGLSDEERARPAFFPADEVTKAVEWDIAHARRSIDLYCAYVDPVPVRRWLRHLKPRIADNVKVTVHTRPQVEDSAAKLVEELRAAGCEVVERERMHEKVVIIDDTVLWHGSLNLLAVAGPTDLMMRLTDPNACDRVRHIVNTAVGRACRHPARRHPSLASPRSVMARRGAVGMSPAARPPATGSPGGALADAPVRPSRSAVPQPVRRPGTAARAGLRPRPPARTSP